jgi:Gelsolin repeat
VQVDDPLSRSLLEDDHCFLLDCESEIFVWSSQVTPISEKRLGQALARKFLDFERPEWCPIVLAWKGAESMSFRAKFPDWQHTSVSHDYRRKTHSYGSVAPPRLMPAIDCKALLNVCVSVWFVAVSHSISFSFLHTHIHTQLHPCKHAFHTRTATRHTHTHTHTTANTHIHTQALTVRIPILSISRSLSRARILLQSQQPTSACVDDGSGNTQVWVLTASGPTIEKLTTQEKGFFHSNNCYMVLYTYYDAEDRNRQKYIAYFWEGRECRHPKWWPSFLYGFFHPILQRKVGYGRIVPMRVLDGREPPHFMRLFRGVIVVRSGRRSRLRRRLRRQTALFSVSHLSGHTRAVQVPARVSSLHSRDSMLLLTATRLYVWHGRGTSEETRDEAGLVAELLREQRELKEIEEQLEPQPFWDVLEAGHPHHSQPEHKHRPSAAAQPAQSGTSTTSGTGGGERQYFRQRFQDQFNHPPVLYHCSCGTGVFQATKLGGFCQTDLSPTEVFILDAHWDVFVWIGGLSSIATQV